MRKRKRKSPLVFKRGETDFSEAMRIAPEMNVGKWPYVVHQSRVLWGSHFLWDWGWISELLTFVHREDRQHGWHGRDAVIAEFTGFAFAARPVRWG